MLRHSDVHVINEITGHFDLVEKIDPESLTHFLSCLPSNHGPLLPNLRELWWEGRSSHSDPFLLQSLPFLSHSLHTLRISSDDEESSPATRLQLIRGLAGRPDLTLSSLCLGDLDIDDHPNLPSAIRSLLDAQKCLQSVTLPTFDMGPDTIGLLNLPDLRELSITLNLVNPSELETFLLNLASRCHSLEMLDLFFYAVVVSTPAINFKTITPLLQASNLSKLTLRSIPSSSILLHAAEVTAMGRAWPNMESLRIPSSVPISVLSSYAHNLPKLDSLHTKITFDDDNIVFDASTPKFSSLHDLSLIGDPSEDRLLQVSAYLSWICPRKTLIHWLTKHWRRIEKGIQLGHQLQEATTARMAGLLQQAAAN